MLQNLREIVTFLFLLTYHNNFSVYLNYVGYIVRTKIMSFTCLRQDMLSIMKYSKNIFRFVNDFYARIQFSSN